MSDYIKREDAERAIEEDINSACMCYERVEGMKDALDDLDGVSSADVEPVRHGVWKPIEVERYKRKDGSYILVECSICGHTSLDVTNYPYCPNCGAKMDGGNDE